MSVGKYKQLAVAYCCLILLVSSIPGKSIPGLKFLPWDKLMHLVEYGLLGWLLVHSVEQMNVKLVLGIAVVGALMGVLDETWQSLIPDRFPSIYDWVADMAGVILGVVLALKLTRRSSREART